MSSKTKRKYVYQEHLGAAPTPSGGQTIGRVLQARGNNLHQVEDAAGHVYLASMPPKFRRNIWVRRGTFLLLEPIAEGDKVRAEVAHVLSREHVTELRHAGVWPARFAEREAAATGDVAAATEDMERLGLGGNPNRPPPPPPESDDSDDSDDSNDSNDSNDSDGSDDAESESDGDADRSSSESGS
ncbi:probable RNA-binding protein EIF1AD [Pollicipes pollicipes]|uniref:probable RNA-binding protein EIF1AD n=1 Tax=Pollicipes pollicipes TaxID=41117 RepID=UPI0018858201|nr:probable RNA-binding protein EIF1AD [Pollicipes pollicipes]